MKIKPLIQLKLLGLFLFSCTIDANLNEDYKNKVKGILNKAADNQETTSADTNSNAAKNIPTADKVAAELKKQSQAAKTVEAAPNKGSQNQQAAPSPQLQSLSFSADLSNLPKTTAARAASLTKQRIPIQAVTTVPGNTRTFNSRNSGLPTFALNYSFSQPTRQQTNSSSAVQTTTSSGSKLQTLKNELIRAISEEKNKTQNNFGFRETYDQFKMKDSAFELLDVISSAKVYDRSYAPQLNSNTPEAENERNKFYALMDFDQYKIEQFGSIMETLYNENQNHSLIRELMISGLGTQISFELALEEINKKIEIFNQDYLNAKINSFDFTMKLKELKSKLNQILDKRKEWSRQADGLIANASSNSSLSDSKSLAEYIKKRYLDNMQNARQSVLEAYISIM
ncbi:complement regulator-acquiring protein [Borreliella burgdorferi]|uniref:complement regulator-acquiring protein n=1 Tax=Borreliella burgdorferi TaxID=139 RepID=UPI0026F42073|nr:complement regulator-acquiring protein [Borreliella burgdorferi]MDO7256691.1 complement regulator-acquiring protein [Borreliella burgdorferi]MDO7279409.1 complement regulator-acquiring protein [Borreliella burgdorferi]